MLSDLKKSPPTNTSCPSSAVSLSLSCVSLLIFIIALTYGISKPWGSYAVLWFASIGLLLPTLIKELIVSSKHWVVYPVEESERIKRTHFKRLGLVVTLAIWILIVKLTPYFNSYGTTLIDVARYPFTVLKNLGFHQYGIYAAEFLSLLLIDRYIVFTDRRLADPYDGFYQVGAWFLGKKKLINYSVLKQHILQWIIKSFFLTLMLSWFNGNIQNLQGRPWNDILEAYHENADGIQVLFLNSWDIFKVLLYTIDLAFGTMGYVLTFKLLGTHVRSAEPTLFGWVICLMCYPPFNQATGEFSGFNDGVDFLQLWYPHATLCTLWTAAILTLLALYAFASVQFGIRFSNLTNRGILTNGLYRLTRHPAYVTKNLMWWMLAIPNIFSIELWQAMIQISHLIVTNIIYYYRAKTEEAHLSHDPVYKQYSAWVEEHGIFSRFKRTFRTVNNT